MISSFDEFANCEWETLTKSRTRGSTKNFISIFKNGILNFSENVVNSLNINEFTVASINYSFAEDFNDKEAVLIKIDFSDSTEKGPLFTFCKAKNGSCFFNIRKLLSIIGLKNNHAIRFIEKNIKDDFDFSECSFLYDEESYTIIVIIPNLLLRMIDTINNPED